MRNKLIVEHKQEKFHDKKKKKADVDASKEGVFIRCVHAQVYNKQNNFYPKMKKNIFLKFGNLKIKLLQN
jgi:hypothetical protein